MLVFHSGPLFSITFADRSFNFEEFSFPFSSRNQLFARPAASPLASFSTIVAYLACLSGAMK
jgi:hypothetical protein